MIKQRIRDRISVTKTTESEKKGKEEEVREKGRTK